MPETMIDARTMYLGPARVGLAAGRRVRLDFPDQQLWAQMATTIPYQPASGDLVLAIGHDDQWYVIGVLDGRGETVFTAPGDVRIHAPRGRIELSSAEEITLRSREVKVAAKKLELLAETVFERFAEVTRWVKRAFSLRAGSLRSHVEQTYEMKAERIVERAVEDVTIDGRQVRLG
jgi:hypothetical protein